jgi:hypothetical protein
MREINCEIQNKTLIDEKQYFELIETQNGESHITPTYQLNHRNTEIGISFKQEVVDQSWGHRRF